ncbi:thiopurine S-methyltransferase [Larsenimonas salina]|uniref:thiopurine S-methyltransferase n=1 Tax=Larsenimonas salina TaxID=1295565 RepID=UPI0020730F38|nr:thiopurine S-methyltransferase [Larsenimonas salina]MCM5703040.1 thiopurine S-methyltransferase [Larsenimonas salina]
MTNDAWLSRWDEGRIGFNLDAPHTGLTDYWSELALARHARVLVPLCGKSVDMRWLAHRGHPVVGVELAQAALLQFTQGSDDDVEHVSRDGFKGIRQSGVEILCGDFFQFRRDHGGPFGAFYDRAALIALPPARRQRYAFHLAQLLPPGAAGLLITLEKTGEAIKHGPPFHVSKEELEHLFDANFERTWLGEFTAIDGEREDIWQLVRKGPVDDEVQVQR